MASIQTGSLLVFWLVVCYHSTLLLKQEIAVLLLSPLLCSRS